MIIISFIKRFPLYSIALIVSVLVFVSFALSVFFAPKNTTPPLPVIPVASITPRPSPIPQSSEKARPIPGASYQIITPENQKQTDQDNLVGQFIKGLPYKGTDFSIDYSFSANGFTLTLNKNNLTSGNSQFDQYLKSKGIESRDWLYNLKVINK